MPKTNPRDRLRSEPALDDTTSPSTAARPLLATRTLQVMSATPIEVYFENDDLFVGWWECVLLNIWKGDQNPEYAKVRDRAGAILSRARSGPLALFTMVQDGCGLPDDTTRHALAHVRLAPQFQRVV